MLSSTQCKILNRKDKGKFILKHYNFKVLLQKDKGLNTSEVSTVSVRAILIQTLRLNMRNVDLKYQNDRQLPNFPE